MTRVRNAIRAIRPVRQSPSNVGRAQNLPTAVTTRLQPVSPVRQVASQVIEPPRGYSAAWMVIADLRADVRFLPTAMSNRNRQRCA